MIRVLIVDDSPTSRALLSALLRSDARIEVTAEAADGYAALDFLSRDTVDVILVDINMPGIDGIETTRRIMEGFRIPTIVTSSFLRQNQAQKTFHAFDAGAVAVLEKPAGPGHATHRATASRLVDTVVAMSEVKVVRRRRRKGDEAAPRLRHRPSASSQTGCTFEAVLVGASTGGPQVIQRILSALPADFPVPILVVQHISRDFVDEMARWLNRSSHLSVGVASEAGQAIPGRVYIAPDRRHMGIVPGQKVFLSDSEPENGSRPVVSFLFRSSLTSYPGRAVGILLTGMGSDGARELLNMKDAGSITIAQDQDSSLVFGMPGEAVKINGARYVLPPEQIAQVLLSLTKKGV